MLKIDFSYFVEKIDYFDLPLFYNDTVINKIVCSFLRIKILKKISNSSQYAKLIDYLVYLSINRFDKSFV